jgi:hypothetical protein
MHLYEVIEHSRVTYSINFTYFLGFNQEVLFISDVHFDSKHCDRKLLRKHMQQAVEKGALIFIVGDFFDVMGTFRDPRSKPADIRPEYLGEKSYLDSIVEDAYKFLKPFANNILGISTGNHETNIIKRHDTDLIDRLVFLLKNDNEKIIRCGYSGWLVFNFRNPNKQKTRKKVVKFHHGERGNALRTKGLGQVDIDAGRWPDADIIVKGDDHMKWHYPSEVRHRLTNGFDQYEDVQEHLRLGSYKNGYDDGYKGYEVEKNYKLTKLGGWWVNFVYKALRFSEPTTKEIEIQILEAK